MQEQRSVHYSRVSDTRRQTVQGDQEAIHKPSEHEIVKSKSKSDTIKNGLESLKRNRILMASVGMVIAIAVAWFIRDSLLYEHTDDAHVDGHITPLSARINGQIQQANVIEGQLVHVGDVLVSLDQAHYNVAVYQAQANVADAENIAATLYYNAAITATSAYGGLYSAVAAVKNAQANVTAAAYKFEVDAIALKQTQANVPDIAQATSHEREDTATVSQEGVLAADKQAILQARDKLLQAVTELRNSLTAPQQASLAKAKAQQADSQVMVRKAQLEQAQLNLSYTIIRSPVTGIVGKRRAEVGQNVRVGQELIDIVSLDDVWITANFKETQLAQLRPGQPVEIKVDAYSRTWPGHVTNLGGCAHSVFTSVKDRIGNYVNVVQRVPVRIDFDRLESGDFNSDGLLKPGLSVEPEVRVHWARTRQPGGLPNSSSFE